MTQALQYTFRLFGPNKGKTMEVSGHQFVNGEARLVGAPQNMGHVLRVLGYYGAFAMGTAEYDAAVAREKEQEAEADGADEVHEDAESGASEAPVGDVQPEGGEPSEEGTEDGAGDASDSEGEAGVRPEGDGHEDAGVPDFSEAASLKEPEEPKGDANTALAAAVSKLDPENDAHWTKAGLPALSAVEEAYGRAGVTRKDVEAAMPGWNRDAALEKAVADL